jgi:hypothetical protein
MEMRCIDSSWAPAAADSDYYSSHHEDGDDGGGGGGESAAESLRDSPILCLEFHVAANDLLPTILGRLQQLVQLPLEVRHFHPVQLPRFHSMYVRAIYCLCFIYVRARVFV